MLRSWAKNREPLLSSINLIDIIYLPGLNGSPSLRRYTFSFHPMVLSGARGCHTGPRIALAEVSVWNCRLISFMANMPAGEPSTRFRWFCLKPINWLANRWVSRKSGVVSWPVAFLYWVRYSFGK